MCGTASSEGFLSTFQVCGKGIISRQTFLNWLLIERLNLPCISNIKYKLNKFSGPLDKKFVNIKIFKRQNILLNLEQSCPLKSFVSVGNTESAMLEQALAMSMQPETVDQPTPSVPDFGSMSEEEQIAYAMQMSLANSGK